MAKGHGRRWMRWLQRYHPVSRTGFGVRRGTSRRSSGRNEPTTKTTRASGTPSSRRGMPSPAPSSARETQAAATRPRQRVISTFSRAKPSRAGSSVVEAIIVTPTVIAAARPIPATNSRPISRSPSSDTTTVMPAKTTARPAVSMAAMVATSGSWSRWRYSRNRVTMNSA